MKRTTINIIAALAVIAGLVASVTAPSWVVWLVCFPVIFAGVLVLIHNNTDWIEYYG